MPELDLEAEYNNRERVPEHPAIIAGWAQDAEAYRKARPDAKLDQVYGPSPRNIYDFFPAEQGSPAQRLTALFIHGGYWQALDKSYFSHMARGLNARGFDVVVANYSLCPAISVGGITGEMQALAGHIHRLTGRRLAVYGHSAGGHLTAALMAADWEVQGLPAGLVAAAMPISGLFDLVPLVSTSVNAALGLDEDSARAASPISAPKPTSGRYIAVVGGAESSEYLRQSRLLTSLWQGPALSGELDILEGANHFTVILPLADPSSTLVSSLAGIASDH
ncbi:alpha/beta hydrolase [Roseibium litorale]|uniref:Alpha/beta hydrolase n=1 Tax=Roseibium litorale TaxID=2803841 RepID=A0ABR9CRG1_9HYPH|nr:alpha/beta hydrolase [Roseibium litorale]MBD8893461.1 alpha/beta hydrolase [Roseibium litorale]